jgi:argininosuccinate lyase
VKTWQGRIQAPADPLFEAFTSSVAQDQRLARYDVRVSQAHARALARAGVIPDADAKRLVEALQEIAAEVECGTFQWRDELEDVHTHVESRLRQKLGPLADSLHAGRSRNDQVAADLRLWLKDRTLETLAALLDLQEALLGLADRYRSAVMPGYTHLQQAQPVLIAQPLLAYAASLGRDWERFREVLPRIDRSPLGSGALAGSTFPLDRDLLARECGFAAVIPNSLDAVGDRDFAVEFTSAAALCMTHLSRFGEDLVLWSSAEFGFLRLPDAFASGSSMMPQKKNPDVAELIRGKAALVIGDATAALALVKGLPLGYNRDLQEDKTPLYHAADTLLACLRVLAAMVPQLEFDTERTERAVSGFTLATDLADYLVRKGVPFRQAHSVIAGLVSSLLERGRDLASVSPEELQAAVGEGARLETERLPSCRFDDLPELTPPAAIRRKRTAGSTHPDAVEEQIGAAVSQVGKRRTSLEGLSVSGP